MSLNFPYFQSKSNSLPPLQSRPLLRTPTPRYKNSPSHSLALPSLMVRRTTSTNLRRSSRIQPSTPAKPLETHTPLLKVKCLWALEPKEPTLWEKLLSKCQLITLQPLEDTVLPQPVNQKMLQAARILL